MQKIKNFIFNITNNTIKLWIIAGFCIFFGFNLEKIISKFLQKFFTPSSILIFIIQGVLVAIGTFIMYRASEGRVKKHRRKTRRREKTTKK